MIHEQGMFREGTFDGKTIVITGGATGLGKSMAGYLSELGANVVIASRKMENLRKTADEIQGKTGNKVLPISCDVRDYEQVEGVLKGTLDEFGSVDGLINNAAGNFVNQTHRLSHRAFDTIVDIVLKGSYYMTLAFGKHWLKENQTNKSILNIVTTYAWTGSAFVVPSACAKAGVLSLTRSLAVEWGPKGIRSNAIAPGPFPTKGAWERLLPGDLKEKFDITKKVPLGRVGHNQELANLTAYLLSDYSAYVNGEVITIDGGEWIKGAGQFNMLEEVPDYLWDMLEGMSRMAKSK